MKKNAEKAAEAGTKQPAGKKAAPKKQTSTAKKGRAPRKEAPAPKAPPKKGAAGATLASRLLDAHVQHELKLLTKKSLEKTLRTEVEAAFVWMQDIQLRDIASPEQVVGIIRRNAVEMPIAGGLTELIGEMARQVLASQCNQDFALEDIFPRKQFDALVDKGAGMEKVRQAAIRRTVRNSAYARLIADAIYTVAKEFVFQDNMIIQKVPGLASLIKLGQGAMRVAVPRLEPSIDAQIKERIEAQVEAAIQESEEFLMGFLDADRIAGISDETWNYISKVSLADHYSNIEPDDMEDFIVIGYEFWLHFRETQYFETIYTELVHYFFEKYGDKELDVLIDDVGVTPEIVIREVLELIQPIVDKLRSTGHLETRLREHLKSFYESKTAKALLEQ